MKFSQIPGLGRERAWVGRNPYFGADMLSGFEVQGSFASTKKKICIQFSPVTHSSDHFNIINLPQAWSPMGTT